MTNSIRCMKGTLLWDFDGTLADRPFMWSSAFLNALDEQVPNHSLNLEGIKPHLQSGFPWHYPDQYIDPVTWWERMEEFFSAVFTKLGHSSGSRALAKRVHELAVDHRDYRVYDDVVSTLSSFKESGWKQVVLSNHIPDLSLVIDRLGLGHLFDAVITSAQVGYSKPHPAIFEHALRASESGSPVWMIGDNLDADIKGAEKAGIKAILVRKQSLEHERCCLALSEVSKWIEPEAWSRLILQGQSVRIEPLEPKHLPSLEKNFDSTLFQYYPRTDYRSAQDFCDENWECEKSGTFEPFAIIDQKTGEAIGCVEYSSINRAHRKLEIGGSWLGRKFQGGPWNTEAKLLLLTEAFERRKCLRVQFGTDSLNVQSQSALEKIGAKREGVFRNDKIQPDGRIRHNVYFSIIADEWPQTKELLVARLRRKLESRE